jgi:hypothetical protein
MPPKRGAVSTVAASNKRPRPSAPTASPLTDSTDSTESDTSMHEESDGSHNSELGSDASDTALQSAVEADAQDGTPFESDLCLRSRFPIFRDANVVVREPPKAEKSEAELAEMTFDQWLNYFLSHPSFAGKRKYLLSDDRYACLLNLCVSQQRIPEFITERKLDNTWGKWLYHAMAQDTYKYILMEYAGRSALEIDKGAVLVCFKETGEGDRYNRRPAKSTAPLTIGQMRRCIPFSQIAMVLEYCHTGGLKTAHHGQDTTWQRCVKEFDCISRELVRMYVKKCAVCQQKQPRTHKAALVPILSKNLYERIVIDLIDYTRKPSRGFHYVLHAMDHFCKNHWAWP